MNPTDPQMILKQLESIRAGTLQRLNGLTQEQLDWRPGTKREDTGADEWSLGEVFMHIARPLLEGVKPPEGITFLPPPPPYGASREVIQYWFDRARTMTQRMIDNWPANANLELRHAGGFDEESNGSEWLLGYAGHEAAHHRQIDALIELCNNRV